MKKVISVSMVIAMIFILSACSSAEYTETPVTVAVTDENGEVVTDAHGNTVTEVVTDENGNAKTETKKNITVKESKNTTAASNDSQNNNNNDGNSANNGGSGNSGNNNNGSNNNQGGNGSNGNNTTAKDDTTKPTEKPKKRDVTITVNLPYYNEKPTKLTLYWKVGDDKEYTAFDPVDLVLDGKGNNKKQEFTIEDVKGEIHAYIELEGIVITHNDVIIRAIGDDKEHGTITPVTGIEIMDGGME
ncbi:MAG: hypothetical protein K2L19_09140 [Eubacterium sp.]|nr:hypothetical protein [Eubacterium sp.]